ncbi:MAG: prepilin-type N-terminal cleavage/methylation domain-containing protein [Candidatus Scalindua sp.]
MMSKRKKNEEGFTLIELIIVIVILGIIAGVAIPKFIGLSGSARVSAARGVGAAISGTISARHADYLINANTYTAQDVLDDTAFTGGVSVSNDANTLTFVSGPTTFTWAYTDQSGDTAAFIAEATGFP